MSQALSVIIMAGQRLPTIFAQFRMNKTCGPIAHRMLVRWTELAGQALCLITSPAYARSTCVAMEMTSSLPVITWRRTAPGSLRQMADALMQNG